MATKSGWTVGYASKAVEREMLRQPESIRSALLRIRRLIEDEGIQAVPSHYIERVYGEIWEMRLRGKNTIARALYLKRMGIHVIIVHVFTKKTQKIERRHIELALRRAKEVDNAEKG